MKIYPRWGKRWLDVCVAIVAGVVLLPIAIAFGLALRHCSPGPLFYTQLRAGHGGKPFKIWKLRTMHTDADQRLRAQLQVNAEQRDQWEREQCLPADPRVAGRLGRFCRAYSIDEIPQLINVLRGDMSIVGPRPLTTDDTARFVSPASRAARLAVKPGMTGLWQVARAGKRDISRNLEALDLRYLHAQSLRLDLEIMLRTVPAVLSGGGQY